jgi:hypothetical protein
MVNRDNTHIYIKEIISPFIFSYKLGIIAHQDFDHHCENASGEANSEGPMGYDKLSRKEEKGDFTMIRMNV